jgi:hypothetical protein
MLDIETLDTSITAAIVAIGAVSFDPRGVQPDEDSYRVTISEHDNLKNGRTVSKSTLDWWRIQSDEAKAAVFDGPHVPLSLALQNFAMWVNKMQPTCTRIWAKSPDFDCSIMIHAFKEAGIFWPFKFWESFPEGIDGWSCA